MNRARNLTTATAPSTPQNNIVGVERDRIIAILTFISYTRIHNLHTVLIKVIYTKKNMLGYGKKKERDRIIAADLYSANLYFEVTFSSTSPLYILRSLLLKERLNTSTYHIGLFYVSERFNVDGRFDSRRFSFF